MNPDALLDQPFAVPLQLSLAPQLGVVAVCWSAKLAIAATRWVVKVSTFAGVMSVICSIWLHNSADSKHRCPGWCAVTTAAGFLTLCSLLWAPMHCCACFPIASGYCFLFEASLCGCCSISLFCAGSPFRR